MMQKLMNRRNKKGFTLIELIVVIAILAILAAIAIPRFAGLQENANRKAVLANLRTIDSAVKTYAINNNVADNSVTSAMLISASGGGTGLVPIWPLGPKTVTYDLAGGVPTATVNGSVPGLSGSYTTASASIALLQGN